MMMDRATTTKQPIMNVNSFWLMARSSPPGTSANAMPAASPTGIHQRTARQVRPRRRRNSSEVSVTAAMG